MTTTLNYGGESNVLFFTLYKRLVFFKYKIIEKAKTTGGYLYEESKKNNRLCFDFNFIFVN